MFSSVVLFGCVREWEPRNVDEAHNKSCSATPDITQAPIIFYLT